jgi:chorismate mutase
MSPSSQESKLQELRDHLAEVNFRFFLTLDERKQICEKIQACKLKVSSHPHYDPSREKIIFQQLQTQLRSLALRELLAFSLIMEEHAQTGTSGAYPQWSLGVHLATPVQTLTGMINPLLLKVVRPDDFSQLQLNTDFSFLKDF